jgi:hypothetical protein
MRATKWLQPAKPAAGVKLDAPSTPSQSTLPADRLNEIQAAVEASPSGIAVIFVRGHQVPGKSMNFSTKDRFSDGSPSWDHVAVVWKDANGNLVFAEARPANGAWGVPFFGKNSPGTARELVTEYKDVKVVPIDLNRYGPEGRDAFVKAVITATGPGSYYSASNKNVGTICSAVVQKGLDAAHEAHKPTPPGIKYLKESWQRMSILGLNLTKVNLYTPKTAYLDVAKHSVPFRFDPKAPLAKREWLVVGEVKIAVVETANAELDTLSPVLSSVALESKSHDLRIDDASLQPATGQGKQTSQQELKVALDDQDDEGDEDALTDDDSLQDPETDADDDEDDLGEEVNLASGTQDARTRDTPQQPEIDDDADDDDDTLMDDADPQPVIDDDDEEPAEEDDEEDELVDASDAEDAPADTSVMQTAKAEAGAEATADDQPGPQLAASTPDTAGDGFSFSAFPKPGVPLEVAKEALPADQASPGEESSSSGTPGSEGAHPDLDSADVGNAAPSKDPVVHHGELAP